MATPVHTYALATGMPERRRTGPDGFKRMVGVSLLVHAVLIVGVALTPASWRTRRTDPREVMTISLGGAPGPRAGGLTSMSGRPVQQAVPPKPEEKPAPIAPPAAKPPEMVEPTKAAPKPLPKPVTPPQTATDQGRAKAPSTGARVSEGQAKADTGVVSDSIGLSTGGGGTGGQINLGTFCCPAYVGEMLQIIHRNWRQQQGARGSTFMRFKIDRQGTLSEIAVARTSGNFLLDQAATRALTLTKLPPLPREYTNPTLTVDLEFNFTQ
ncbi:protein TolA [Luteitalea pratensis]|uniref:Protein TolA n=1 Tax=Luteitalea pratensis TaxID=1855912 RepID=A0A143PR44_LUTPR|nr:TonB family protein [Luteitalea pratensis]AMY10284.1 protein TolA [Luteitalea pratensis]